MNALLHHEKPTLLKGSSSLIVEASVETSECLTLINVTHVYQGNSVQLYTSCVKEHYNHDMFQSTTADRWGSIEPVHLSVTVWRLHTNTRHLSATTTFNSHAGLIRNEEIYGRLCMKQLFDYHRTTAWTAAEFYTQTSRHTSSATCTLYQITHGRTITPTKAQQRLMWPVRAVTSSSRNESFSPSRPAAALNAPLTWLCCHHSPNGGFAHTKTNPRGVVALRYDRFSPVKREEDAHANVCCSSQPLPRWQTLFTKNTGRL